MQMTLLKGSSIRQEYWTKDGALRNTKQKLLYIRSDRGNLDTVNDQRGKT